MYIDHSVYPDMNDPPESLGSRQEKADYVHRVCAAWDFRIHPEPETFDLFSTWKDVFDQFPIPASPAYHAFRAWFRWDPVAAEGHPPTPHYVHLDRLEDRPPDPCEELI